MIFGICLENVALIFVRHLVALTKHVMLRVEVLGGKSSIEPERCLRISNTIEALVGFI